MRRKKEGEENEKGGVWVTVYLGSVGKGRIRRYLLRGGGGNRVGVRGG